MIPQRILIVQTAFIGDVILITPLIRETKKLFPQAQVDALVTPQTRGVLANNPHLSRVHVFNKRGFKPWAFLRTAWALRRRGYDLAVSPHSSMTTSWLLRLAGIPERLGFDRWRQAKALTLKVSTQGITQRVDKNMRLLSALGVENPDRSTELFPGEEDRERVDSLLRDAGLPPGAPLVAVAPGSVWNTKRWPQESYAALCRRLSAEGVGLVFIGSDQERDLCRRILQEGGGSGVNLAGELSLLGSAQALSRCRALVCNDSGALHLANAVGTPVAAMFGPTVRDLGYFPLGPEDRVFEVEGLPCRPCGSHGHQQCPEGHFRCMLELPPDPVADHLLGLLKASRT